MNDAAPTLSVLCLTYNHAAFVAQALESIVAQRVDFPLEVIVADDCSTDDTASIVERYREQLGARLRVLRTPVNLGVARNFRRALAACRGRYVAMCEGDDHWRGTDKLQSQVEFLEAHPDYVLAFHDATFIGQGAATDEVQLPERFQRDATQAELIATRPISTLTVCFRNVLPDLPPELDQAPALDLCLWSLLGHHGKGRYLGEIEPAAYRVHAAGVFSTQTELARYAMTAQSLLCLARVYARTGQPALADKLLLRATVTACRRLSVRATLELVVAAPVWLVLRLLRRAWLTIFAGRRV